MHRGAVLCIRTCYVNTRQATGYGRPVGEACHTLIGASVAWREGGDGEGASVELHIGQGVLVQGTASEAPGHGG